jgi:hypothetical protein
MSRPATKNQLNRFSIGENDNRPWSQGHGAFDLNAVHEQSAALAEILEEILITTADERRRLPRNANVIDVKVVAVSTASNLERVSAYRHGRHDFAVFDNIDDRFL